MTDTPESEYVPGELVIVRLDELVAMHRDLDALRQTLDDFRTEVDLRFIALGHRFDKTDQLIIGLARHLEKFTGPIGAPT
jgi:hypothetical protein